MNILQVISSANPAGGGPIAGALQFDTCFRTAGHRCQLATLDDPSAPWIPDVAADTVPLGPGAGTYGYTRRLRPWLQAHASQFDAVVTHGLWQYHTMATRRAVQGSRTPYFVFTHGMLDPYFKHRYPLKHWKKAVYWTAFEHDVVRDAAAVLFTCEEERLLARESFRRYAAREEVVSFGATRPEVPPRDLAEVFLEAHPHLRDRRIVLFLGRIHEKKGCDLAIEAFARCAGEDKRLVLVMAGPGDPALVARLQSLAASRGVSARVTWPGMLTGARKWGALAAAEVFLLPSHQENFGAVVAESLAMGTPVLVSNKVNIWREIEADRAGFVADDSVDGTVRNLGRWLDLPAQEQAALRARAEQCFSSRFQMQAVAERMLKLIQQQVRP